MKGWLLDTNVVSELRKPHCDRKVREWSEAQPTAAFYLSRITIAEIRFGVERVPPTDPFRAELEIWLETQLRPWFRDRLLDIDEDVILTWRRLVERGRAQNHTFAQPDLFIAATAALHGLCVVTRNVDDFLRAGVPVLNPWLDAKPRGPA